MTYTPIKSVRYSIPVSPEVGAIFQGLADVSGRSMAATISQWLFDTREAARLMGENLERLRESPGEMVMKVRLHTSSIEDAAELAIQEAMERAQSNQIEADSRPPAGREPRGRAPLAAANPAPVDPLTPPSSNTGGKVHSRGKKSRGA